LLKELSDAAPARPDAVFIPTPDETSWPHMNPVIAITKSLALRSQVAVEASDSESAVRSIQASLRLTRAMSDEPTLIGQLVAMTTSINEQNSIWSLIHRRTATETQLARLQSDLERQDFMNSMTQALRGERALFIHGIERMQREHIVRTQADLFVKQQPSWLEKALDWLVPTGWFDHNAVTVLHLHPKYFLEPLKTRDVGRMETSFDEFERMIADHASLASPHHVLAFMTLPSFRFVIEQAIYSEAVRRQAVTAIAIERFRLAHGRLPGTLAGLVPSFIQDAPLDPMDNNSLRYQAEADNFTLWSIAWDQQDDHGRLPTKKEASGIHRSESYVGDWVWKN
jgi:type II secretory pathway pseudopilin PulG